MESKEIKALVAERSSALGYVGGMLASFMPKCPEGFSSWKLDQQAEYVVGRGFKDYSGVERLAVSILCCKVPIHVELFAHEISRIVDQLLPPLPKRVPKSLNLGKNRDGSPTYPSQIAGIGGLTGMLRFGDVVRDFAAARPALFSRFTELSGFTRGLTDEIVTAAIMFAYAIDGLIEDPVAYALRNVLNPEESKNLSVVIKSAGLTATAAGAMLCESNSLLCKGYGDMDLRAKAMERVGRPGDAGTLPNIGKDELRDSVRKIIRDELRGRTVEFETAEGHWRSRWAWTVNGGHSRVTERRDKRWSLPNVPGRAHRRAAVEEWTDNPLTEWDGEVTVTASAKMECGKQRLILACDTLSYVCFEHLLRPVENAWRNQRVLLDPGQYGQYGTCKRVLDLRRGGGDVWVMLDYDDFNSQHTLESQALVIEVLCEETGYDEEYARRLVESFGKMEIYMGGESIGGVTATLMSGHRGTTFINSVLNAAYIRVALGKEWDHMRSLHTGDDIVMSVRGFEEAGRIAEEVRKPGLRFNPIKQSVGSKVFEFLRMAGNDSGARGYLCRSIGAAVSGNVAGGKMSCQEAGQTMITNARSMINRSYSPTIVDLMLTAFRRRTGIPGRIAKMLLSGEAALGPGPCYQPNGRIRRVEVNWGEVRDLDKLRGSVGGHATSDYLSYRATPFEISVLEGLGRSVTEQMLMASYAKTLLDEGSEEMQGPKSMSVRIGPALGCEDASRVFRRVKQRGELSRFPIISLVRGQLKFDDVVRALRYLGVEPGRDPMVTAWGERDRNVIILGTLGYGDASRLCSLAKAGMIVVDYPVNM